MTGSRKHSEDRYWRELPLRSAIPLLIAMAATFGSLGFVIDLVQGGAGPFRGVVALAVYTALAATGLGLVILRKRQWLIPAVIAFVVLTAVVQSQRGNAGTPKVSKEVQARFAADAALLVALAMVGYGLSLKFITDTGIEQLRMRMELRMASEIQQGLVPDVEMRTAKFELCGRSSPGAEVGGDLVDAVECGTSVLAYVADVSGHGVPAGLLTGMVKTAARSAVEKEVSLEAVLATVNRVLPSVKASNMYATFAGLELREDGSVEYATAGHGPILLCRSSGGVERLAIEQFPLGMFPPAKFVAAQASCEPGDLLVITTDGFAEVRRKDGQEFGIEAIEHVAAAQPGEPLTTIRDRLFREVRAFGAQEDDQTVLLVRRCA